MIKTLAESKAQLEYQKPKIVLCNKRLTSDYILHTSTDEFIFHHKSDTYVGFGLFISWWKNLHKIQRLLANYLFFQRPSIIFLLSRRFPGIPWLVSTMILVFLLLLSLWIMIIQTVNYIIQIQSSRLNFLTCVFPLVSWSKLGMRNFLFFLVF